MSILASMKLKQQYIDNILLFIKTRNICWYNIHNEARKCQQFSENIPEDR